MPAPRTQRSADTCREVAPGVLQIGRPFSDDRLIAAFIGLGSIQEADPSSFRELTVPEFADTTFAFTDLNQHNLEMVKQLAERDIAGNNLEFIAPCRRLDEMTTDLQRDFNPLAALNDELVQLAAVVASIPYIAIAPT